MTISRFNDARASTTKQKKKLKIAFVVTWFGENIGGGAEAECRGLVHHIRKLRPEAEVEVITTCLKEFATDWNQNYHPEGFREESGIPVHRFLAMPYHRHGFGTMNDFRLTPPITSDLHTKRGIKSPLTPNEEDFYIKNMVHSPNLYRFLKKKRHQYDFFIFMPYMFGITYTGIGLLKRKAIIIPCLHDERYAYMKIYRKMMKRCGAALFHVPAEMKLANRIYQIKKSRQLLLGEMVDTNPKKGSEQAFRETFGIHQPYILYAGRKITGKNLPLLVSLFTEVKKKPWAKDIQLVIIGSGDLSYKDLESSGIHDLGFVTKTQKLDAMAGATMLCQPSLNESFSIVMMEAWLQETPVLAHQQCEVTKDHCEHSGGGLTFRDYKTFEEQLRKALTQDSMMRDMAMKGKQYVLDNYSPQMIVDRFVDFLLERKHAW